MIADQQQRQQAINPDQSFIVQAPAGSGKTELLIQRLLTLLTRVQQPEAIVAITFTRKAAAEMQERILTTLQHAQQLTQPLSQIEQPERERLRLAQKVLHADYTYGWQLLANPQRLRIQTIDSLCHYLVSRLPITARLGAPMNMTDQPYQLYQQAIQSFITDYLDTGEPQALGDLFSHLNHQFEYIETLLIQALQQRDQWLTLLHNPEDSTYLRSQLEAAMQTIVNNQLTELDKACEQHNLKSDLLQIMQQASQNSDNPNIQAWAHRNTFVEAHYDNLASWQGIAEVFLTQKNEIRRQITKKQGIPAHSPIKYLAQALLDYLQQNSQLNNLIKGVKTLPQPIYEASNWQLLKQLLTQILPRAAAHLQLTFQKKQILDFQEVALQALNALGTTEQASDLLLALDYQIEHILVDEFQDTSYLQINLLQKLTADWDQTPHKTLFLVGDPMQSIYRFRNAEVNIFLQLWHEQQFNNIPLIPLQLKANFRSSLQVVNWINETLATLLPQVTDINIGAVPGVTAQAIHKAQKHDQIITSINNQNSEQQAQTIVNQILQWQQAHADWDIAILVQKRSHLAEILPALQKARIAYQSQDLLPLTKLAIIQDLLALTRALYHFEDRTAWLACLRAPWCGITKKDLAIIAQKPNVTIWQQINDSQCWQNLSQDAQNRLKHWCQAVHQAQKQHGRISPAEWIDNAWQQLLGPACLRDDYEQQASQQFFDLLLSASTHETIDLPQFEQLLNQHYLSSPQSNEAKVHIMRIHKAKGLEFDAVIIPSLQAKRKSPDPALFLWTDYYLNNQHYSLLAPIKRSDQTKEQQPLYQFINELEKQRLVQENKRLFYVALTRAKSALCLTAYINEQNVPHNSFLNYLNWQQEQLAEDNNNKSQSTNEQPIMQQPLRRLKTSSLPSNSTNLAQATSSNIKTWQTPRLRLRGTLIHFMLQIISDDWQDLHTSHTTDKAKQIKQLFNQRYPLWLQKSRQLGIEPNHDDFIKTCQAIINQVAEDKIGQWLLEPKQFAHNEMALAVSNNQNIHHYRPDRIFQEHEAFWVIDYKTTTDDTSDHQQLWQEHRDQIQHYQQLLKQLWQSPVHKGIYLPINRIWLCEYDNQSSSSR